MIGRLLLAFLLLLPVPALADVTAIYATGKEGKNSMTVEASDDGRARVTFGENATLIYRDGTAYLSTHTSRGSFTVRLDDFLMVAREGRALDPMPKSLREAKFELQSAGQETVAGYVGTAWQIRQSNGPRENADAVSSEDPMLAPLARFFRAIVPKLVEAVGIFEPNPSMAQMLVELFSKGAPLRFAPIMTLESAEIGPIEADRFEVPSPVLSLEQLRTLQASEPKEPKESVTVEIPSRKAAQ
jgi:hypothetical protein